MSASVKIMRSYDYCHFEICLGTDEDVALEQIDSMRKDAMRLVDKAVEQYQLAKKTRDFISTNEFIYERLKREAKAIKENFPQSEWTPEQKAKIKEFEDMQFKINRQYDYEDDWEC